jgi:cytochrome c peroxidase
MNSKPAAVAAIILCGIISTIAINSCRKSASDRRNNSPITFNVPQGFPEPVYNFNNNPLTEEGFALGRKLFHDSRLSAFNDVNCGSCHQQMAAYTTFDHDLGHGTNFQHTTRNVPGIFNMAWHPAFQWDGGVLSLEDQVIACIEAPEKMAESINGLRTKLDTAAEYKRMFLEAFGDESIDMERISKAISQFVVRIVSADSKYDKVKRGAAQFNASEAAGYELFKTNCSSCHQEPLFTDFSYRNIGLPHRPFHDDEGRMKVTGSPDDSLKFKVPSLRNAGLTSYYAHDGRYAGITEVLDHYTSDKEQTPSLDPLLQSKMQLTNLEKFYLMEFLFALSDSALVNDADFR